ncbi:hypothetical protein [Streptomyces sp. NPDC127084]|uniref:hypothetical protein n=1 Tax=Streptomyces sp. NPDC127084 TaxID=3347133 RepID=UPI00365B994B
MSPSPRLRLWLTGVLAVNVVAATAIGVFAAIRPWDALFTALLAAEAVEVAGRGVRRQSGRGPAQAGTGV